ncbi:MAG: hypothetical protein ACREWJ_11310, partial [Rhodoferax sp.]
MSGSIKTQMPQSQLRSGIRAFQGRIHIRSYWWFVNGEDPQMGESAAPRIFMKLNDKRVVYMPDRPAITGRQGGGYVFERQLLTAAGQIPPHQFEEHIFMLPLSTNAVRFRSRLNGHALTGFIEPGKFRFVAAGD